MDVSYAEMVVVALVVLILGVIYLKPIVMKLVEGGPWDARTKPPNKPPDSD